jgi:uncharacterized protein YabE (DUF348 family)
LVEETGVPGEKPLTYRVTYRFMNEIIATNESEWAEHMYVVFACYVLFMLLCIGLVMGCTVIVIAW